MNSSLKEYTLLFINFNAADLIVRAVQSLSEPPEVQSAIRIIVMDNGSTDDSLQHLAANLPDAEVVPLGANSGFARAVNAGLQLVRERFLFILNADVEFCPNAIYTLSIALAQDKQAVLACPRLMRPDGSEQRAALPEPSLFWELFNRSLHQHLLDVPKNGISRVPSIVGPCMAVDTEKMKLLGPMDDRFFFFFEETDWCKRAQTADLHVIFVPEARIIHLQGEVANRRPIRARVQFYESRYRYFRKWYGAIVTTILFIGLWMRLTVNLLVYALLSVILFRSRKQRDRLAVTAALWSWHFFLCRPRWSFEPVSETESAKEAKVE